MKFQHNKNWRWYVNRNIMKQTVDLYWMGQGVNGESFHRVFTEIKETVVEQGMMHSPDQPTLEIDYEQADSLMQELWDAGVRPKGVETGQAHVDALQKHIDSLQKTVEHFMDINSLTPMEALEGMTEASPFEKLSMDFQTLWKKVDSMADTLALLITAADSAQKAAESLQKAEKKI